MEVVPAVVLNSGHKMPLIGMGTASVPLPPVEQLTLSLLDAIEAGYRHFDTAAVYGSEEALGRAVAEAVGRGLVESRDQLFITSKLWCTDAHLDLVLPALNATLQRLGMEYVDLYLVHWPVRFREGIELGFNFTKDDIFPFDIKRTWEAMEECSRLGLAKSVGVSNYGSRKLSTILLHATIPPAINQVEMINPSWQQGKLREYCKEKGIHVSAYSPLGANGAFWGSLAVMESPILKAIAAARGKSVAQVALRWIYEQGASAIVKSFNKERMKQNLEIFDWELREDELAQIRDHIPQQRTCPSHLFINPDADGEENGIYKSVDDLWDGDA